MAVRDIVVIGASAGGVAALTRLFGNLPGDFAGAIFVALHVGSCKSALDQVLSNAGPLPVAFAHDNVPFQLGNVYLAPPDLHLLIRAGRMHLRSGARENLSRPAIDPLFRSAAVHTRERAIGIIMTGAFTTAARAFGPSSNAAALPSFRIPTRRNSPTCH